MTEKLVEVFSSGGGTQSTAIAALIIQGKLPKPDYVVIADTGRECSSTWKYMTTIVAPAMKRISIDVQVVKPEWALHSSLWDGSGNLLPAVWSNQNGDVGKAIGFCSKEWKVRPMDRYLSQKYDLTRSKYRKWIGFSADEWRRSQRMIMGEEGRKGLIWLPLAAYLHLNRHEAIQVVKDMGWPEPPRSRCWMCPNQTDNQWRDLKENYPDDFRAASDIEREFRKDNPYAWLHKSCRPLDTVEFKNEQDGLFDPGVYCNSGVCFV